MKKMRVLALVREGLVPPDTIDGLDDKDIAEWKVEFDVVTTLRDLGHEVRPIGVFDDLGPIRRQIQEWKPHIVFMLLEEFHGVGTYDQAIVSYLELMRQPYTGCNPRGLLLSHDKALSKKILSYHRIPTPKFSVYPIGRQVRRSKRLEFPLIVKSVVEDASLGISQASLVKDDAALAERVAFIHESIGTDAIAEQYIEGRELYMGVIGNQRLQTFPVWEMLFEKMPEDVARIATARVKWDPKYQKKHGIDTERAKNLPEGVEQRMGKLSKRVYRALNMSGYARMDMRLSESGRLYVIEANANPNLEYGEDLAESAGSVGVEFETLIQRILNLGLRYHAPWKGT